jgi:biopolymer transport protein ExbD
MIQVKGRSRSFALFRGNQGNCYLISLSSDTVPATQLPRNRRLALPLSDLGIWSGVLLTLSAMLMTSGRFALPAPPVQVPVRPYVYSGCLRREGPSLVLSLDAQGRFYIDADYDSRLQTTMAQHVANQHHVHLTAAQLTQLRTLPFLSQNIERLPAFLSASRLERSYYSAGISAQPGNDQVSEYLRAGLQASQQLYGRAPYFGIRADKRLPAAQVKHVIRLLQQQGINRFNLLTEYQ